MDGWPALQAKRNLLELERTGDDVLEDLRDRYRHAIAYIDDFTQRWFPARNVRQARAKTDAGLHPFWVHQVTASRRARARLPSGPRTRCAVLVARRS